MFNHLALNNDNREANRVMDGARKQLGQMWGFGRPLFASELGRALLLKGRDPGQTVRNWETGESVMPGPAKAALMMMLRGSLPPASFDTIRER